MDSSWGLIDTPEVSWRLAMPYDPPEKQPSWREMGIEVEDSEEAEARRRGEQKLRPPVKKKSAKSVVAQAKRLLLAMAWDEWSDKIQHNAPEADGTPFGNQGCYTIDHGGSSVNESALLYSLNAEGPEDNSIFIDNLYSHPEFRNQGVAEALFRRLNEDYPGRKINPGAMTGMGQEFHDRMLEKEPTARDLVTAAQRVIEAMAWQDWAPEIKHNYDNFGDGSSGYGSFYVEHESPLGLSRVTYDHSPNEKEIEIGALHTDRSHRNDGVAEALIRKLHETYPDHVINPGMMTADGRAFHDKMLQKEPAARDLVVGAEPQEEGEIPDYQTLYARRRVATAPTVTPPGHRLYPRLETRINSYLSLGMPDEAIRTWEESGISLADLNRAPELVSRMRAWRRPESDWAISDFDDYEHEQWMSNPQAPMPINYDPNHPRMAVGVLPGEEGNLGSFVEEGTEANGWYDVPPPQPDMQQDLTRPYQRLHINDDEDDDQRCPDCDFTTYFDRDMMRHRYTTHNDEDAVNEYFGLTPHEPSQTVVDPRKPVENTTDPNAKLKSPWYKKIQHYRSGELPAEFNKRNLYRDFNFGSPSIADDSGGGWYRTDPDQGVYQINDSRKPLHKPPVGYAHYDVDHDDKSVKINYLDVHPKNRGQGVATALVSALAEDFPDYKINPGTTTGHGTGFVDYMRRNAPNAQERLDTSRWSPAPTNQLTDDQLNSWGVQQRRSPVFAFIAQHNMRVALRRMGMPMADAYDPDAIWHDDYLSPERAEAQLHPGPFYHITPWTLRPGGRLQPSNVRNPEWGNYDYLSDEDYLKRQQTGLRGLSDRRQNWVWMTPRDKVPYWMNLMQGIQAPLNIYEVKPEVEGPWPYNGSGSEGHVSPAATVVREIKHRKSPTGQHEIDWPEDAPQKLTAAKDFRTRIAAVTQDMVDSLNTQFHDWWGQQNNSGGSVDDMAQMDFMDEDRGPIGHWPNIENFLKDVYPAAHRGLASGMEAEWSLDGHAKPYLTGPEAIKQHGYDPSEIAAGVLLLHNQSDPFRGDMAQQDQDRLNDIAQKRYKMQRNYDSRQLQPAAKDLVTAHRKTAADLVKEYTDGLSQEFHDWAREQEYVPVGFSKNDPAVMNPDYTKPMGGPLSYWDNIEGFFKERYPAVHRGYRYGEENAADALDGRALRMPSRYSPWPNQTYHPGYETGPEAVEKYGYDPRQVAAGFMYLHSTAHNTARPNDRADRIPRDIDRLSDIFQKRQQMQRNYEQRQDNSVKTAMAWQDWSKQIQDQKDEWAGNYQSYNIDHGAPDWWSESSGDWQGSRGSGVSYYVDHDDKNIKIDYLSTHPEFRNRGVAEALMRRIHEDHPGYSIRPGEMTDGGQAFHNRMLEKEPAARDLVTARMLLAMAWDEWAPLIKGGCDNGCTYSRQGTDGRYTIPQAGAFLDYYHYNHLGQDQVAISGIYTHPSNRGDGVAEALIRRLTEDHPGVPIDPGAMTRDGQGFHDRMLEKDPARRDLVVARRSLNY